MDTSELIQIMNELKASRGWQIIMEDIKPLIESAETKLLGDETLDPIEQRNMKQEWRLYKKFQEYPDFLVVKSKIQQGGELPDVDPYEDNRIYGDK